MSANSNADNAVSTLEAVTITSRNQMAASGNLYLRQLTEHDHSDLRTYVQSTVTLDEAMFFLAVSTPSHRHNANSMIFGGYNTSDHLVGALLLNGYDCHVLWSDRQVLTLFSDILRRSCTGVRVSGPTSLCGTFLEHLAHETITFKQEGTTCVLTPNLIRPVRNRAVRCATLSDIKAILALEQHARTHDGEAQLRTEERRRTVIERIQSRTTFIAEHVGQTVAVAYADVVIPQAAHICEVATHPDFRNRGFGASVVATLCRTLFSRVQRVFLTYANDNLPAARAYQKIGFLPYSKRLRAQLIIGAQ